MKIAIVRLGAVAAGIFCLAQAQAQTLQRVPRADGASTPITVYEALAKPGVACAPLLLISHGAGGSEKAMPYLGTALSQDGWRVLVLGHAESGLAPLREDVRGQGLRAGLLKLITDPAAYRARFLDIDAALKFADQRCHAPYRALLGHSMGAITVMLDAGANNLLGITGPRRFDAYVALSPEGPGPVFPPGAWAPITAPMLLLTGTRDQGIAGDYRWRMQAYDGLAPGCRWLGLVDGATHGNFAGSGDAAKTMAATTTLVTAFLDARRAGHCAMAPPLVGVSLQTK